MTFNELTFQKFQEKRARMDAMRKEVTDFMSMVAGLYPHADCTMLNFGETGDRVVLKPANPEVDWLIQTHHNLLGNLEIHPKNLRGNMILQARFCLPAILTALSEAHDRGEALVKEIMEFSG